MADLFRKFFLALLLIAATLVIAVNVHDHYPISKWIFWKYALYFGLSSFWGISCLSFGYRILKILVRGEFQPLEFWVMSFAVGVFSFMMAIFVGGLFMLLKPWFFTALPVVFLMSGGLSFFREIRLFLRERFAASKSFSFLDYTILFFGFLGLLFVYLPILTPYNVAYDARWYHLPIAENYVAAQGVRPFLEGWYLGAYPHFASLLYSWAFLLPQSTLFDRIELAAHLEFILFLGTLVSVVALVQMLLPRSKSRLSLSWVTFFLFPGLFLYDSSLSLAADHVAAFFTIPIFLMFVRTWKNIKKAPAFLLAMMIAGALLIKYASLSVFVFPVLAIFLRFIFLLFKKDGKPFRGFVVFAFSGILLTAPHWLKNWLWYGDPVYPMLYKHLHLHPWSDFAEKHLQESYLMHLMAPAWSLNSLKDCLQTMLTFAFKPHNYFMMHGNVPVFGFLFTIFSVIVFFLKPSKKIVALNLAAYSGIFVWFWLSQLDRYLQIVLPWMVGLTAVGIILLHEQAKNFLMKVSLYTLVVFQVIWGGDVFFIRHALMGQAPIKEVTELLSSGFGKKWEMRTANFGFPSEIGKRLPPHSKILIHEWHIRLGLGAMSVDDWPQTQAGINYRQFKTAGELYDYYTQIGITHILWNSWEDRSLNDDSNMKDNLRFFEFAGRHVMNPQKVEQSWYGSMPRTRPLDSPEIVAVFSCAGQPYSTGLYRISDFSQANPVPFKTLNDGSFENSTEDKRSLLSEASMMLLNSQCHPDLTPEVLSGFNSLAPRKGYQIWARK